MSKKTTSMVYMLAEKLKNKVREITNIRYYRTNFKSCGNKLQIARGVIAGVQNISVGNNVFIGPNCAIYSTVTTLSIGNDFTGGPGLSIFTGDHRFDVVGKTIRETTEKLSENDGPVVIEDDCWCGANVTILKGVTVGRGSIIAAGNVKPYSIYISRDRVKRRFSDKQIALHESLIRKEK